MSDLLSRKDKMHWWTLIRRYLDFFTTCLVGYLNYQYTRRFTKRKPRDNLSPIDDVTKIGPNVIRILGQNPGPFTLQGTNTYLVGSNNKMILIDAGEPDNPRYIDKLRSALGMASIEGIICTHWHHDHLGGCHSVRKHFRTSKGELPPVYKKNRNSAAENGFCEYIGDSHVIKQDNVTLKILDTKGHTSDHISVLYEEESILFSGDCILGEGSTIFEDLGDYMDSLRRLLLLDCKTICPGHGPLITNPKAKIEEYIERREERDRQILKFLCEVERANSLEVTRTLYKGLPKNVHVAAFRSVQLHLKKLERERKVKRIGLIDYALVSKLTPPVSTQSFMCER
ncbi:Beta-lactamase protein 2 [Trichostrongylus colubriformis]|uniref:Beta-lactamase protein 2 n=1 Tax=Trichostrongylus colubriformis TaxID=6319 RepID=A0AAN8FU17_TRICO